MKDGGNTNGLMIDEEEFMALPAKRQMCVLYQNQVLTLKLIQGYRFNQKVQYVILTALVAGAVFLLKLHIGG